MYKSLKNNSPLKCIINYAYILVFLIPAPARQSLTTLWKADIHPSLKCHLINDHVNSTQLWSSVWFRQCVLCFRLGSNDCPNQLALTLLTFSGLTWTLLHRSCWTSLSANCLSHHFPRCSVVFFFVKMSRWHSDNTTMIVDVCSLSYSMPSAYISDQLFMHSTEICSGFGLKKHFAWIMR